MSPHRRPHVSLLAVLGVAVAGLACGSVPPPKELVEARAAYQRAESGQAGKLAPAQVHVAKKALDDAERAFDDRGDEPDVRDRAYVALRKAQIADARAGALGADQNRTQAQKEAGQAKDAEHQNTKRELEETKRKLAQEQRDRVDAERRSKEALEQLAKLAAIKEESRGMVITISGAVLFPSNQSVLLPGAISALDNVVTTLKAAPDRDVIVEGHTDAQGARDYNMDLGLKRAESVRAHFLSRGIHAERVKANGIGPDRPVADNKTPEGRAQNRRVEIIVSPPERK